MLMISDKEWTRIDTIDVNFQNSKFLSVIQPTTLNSKKYVLIEFVSRSHNTAAAEKSETP